MADTERASQLFESRTVDAARLADLRLAIRCIDLTTLEGDDTPARVRALCATARRPDPADSSVGPVAGVCVYPALVGVAAELLAGSPVAAVSVAGAFPSALTSLAVRLADLEYALAEGAEEIDVVLNRSAFLQGDEGQVRSELHQFRSAAADVILKVILETSELGSPTRIAHATELALACGADFVKTSTGKSKAGATPEAVMAMAEAVADHHRRTGTVVGIKVSGGVRTSEDALGYIAIVRAVLGEEWLSPDRFRIGASSLLADLVGSLGDS